MSARFDHGRGSFTGAPPYRPRALAAHAADGRARAYVTDERIEFARTMPLAP